MEVRKGYKQTEIGIIPTDWGVDEIKNVALIDTGAKNTQDRIENGEYPFFVRSQNVEKINTFSFDGEAILTAGDGVGTGKVFHYINGKFDFHQRVYKVSDFKRDVLDGYFFYLYFSNHFYDRIMSMTAKSSVDSVRMDVIAGMEIPLPPFPEQRAIATAISNMDALLKVLDELIAKKRLIKQGAMQELLTGKKRLPGFSGAWEEKELQAIVNMFIVPMRDKPKQFRGDIPWCRIEDFNGKYLYGSKSNQNVDDEIIKMMNLRIHPIGTLLVSCSADLGRCAIVGKPLVTNQTFIGLVFDEFKASNEFFYYYMTYNTQELNNLSTGTTIGYLSRQQFEMFKLIAPSTKKEQTAIAEILSDMDTEIAALEQRREKTRLLRQGIMQELLTGRIRLV